MAWIDYDSMSDTALVSQIVLEMQEGRQMLAYDDYIIIRRWTSLCKDRRVLHDTLLDLLPEYYRGGARSLRGIDKRITAVLSRHR